MLSAPSLFNPSACLRQAAPSLLDTSVRLQAGATWMKVSGRQSPPVGVEAGGRQATNLPALKVQSSTDVSSYSNSLLEALVPLVADHKCSSPEVYGADISPNMLCAGYFDCKSDACQVGCCQAPTKMTQMGYYWNFLTPRESGANGEPKAEGPRTVEHLALPGRHPYSRKRAV